MKIKSIFLSMILVLLSTNIFAQKQDAVAAVKDFYRFPFLHQTTFNQKEVSRRNRFFTPKLRQLFAAELKREGLYFKKHPTDKGYFEGLSFEPIEFCPNDYRVGTARIKRQTAIVRVNFVWGKTSCKANDGAPLLYKISLLKLGGKWLIDDVFYDDGDTLRKAFAKAKR